MRRLLLLALGLAACGESPPPPAAREPVPTIPAPAVEAPAAESMASIRERSGCAFESREALCEALREHYLSSGEAWASDDCASGESRTSNGPFAEVGLLGLRHGQGRPSGEERIETPVLEGVVHEPPSARDGSTEILLAARVGQAWFPIHLFHPAVEGELPGEQLEWSLDPAGAQLTWTHETGASRRGDPDAFGETERTVAVVDRGVPMIAARAVIDRWRSDVDLECARACNRAPSPPAYPACSLRCASITRRTRSWEQTENTVRIGATVVERDGHAADLGQDGLAPEEAETRSLDVASRWMAFCAFMPVVRATPTPSLPMDEASVAARARAAEVLRHGTFREVAGASGATAAGAPRSTIEITGTSMMACGGGACTTGVQFRTIEGSMPVEGVGYFQEERGARIGCDEATLPIDGGSTFVEVAQASSREAIGCGFSGYDGAERRYWVVTRVFVPSS